MNAFPIIRSKLSNEHVMAIVFGVLILYMVPNWIQTPSSILAFSAVLILALVIDTFFNFINYKRPVCAVSAAVTAAIFFILTPGVPVWGRLLGISAALLAGKHIWGGMGKNRINPAIVGVLFTLIFFEIKGPIFTPSIILLPAVIFSLVFIRFRPFASLGLMAGMTAALLFRHELTVFSFIAYGVIFWGCIVLTDPVTMTSRPFIGSIGGCIAGFITVMCSGSVFAMAAGVIMLNLLSALEDAVMNTSSEFIRKKIKKVNLPNQSINCLVDLTDRQDKSAAEYFAFNTKEILSKIEKNKVYGLGGAAFPVIEKIKAIMASKKESKYLIINGAECDPGLIHDHWLMHNYINEIAIGANLLRKCVPFEKVFLAVKDSSHLEPVKDIHKVEIPDYYPAGAEKMIIKHVLGTELSTCAVPAKEGILILNVQTLYAVYEAVCKDKRAETKLITAADLKKQLSYVVKVKLGAGIQSVAESLGLTEGSLFYGGGAMQCTAVSDGDCVNQTTNFIAVGDFPRYKESPLCSRCGFCRQSCPAGIKPDKIAQLMDEYSWVKAKEYEPERCMQCGNCSRVCLAGRNLAVRVKAAKQHAIQSAPYLQVTSTSFEDGDMMPIKYTGWGEDISPPLQLSGVDTRAKTFAIMMDDIDHPVSGFNHWIIWNISAEFTRIPEDVPKEVCLRSLGNAIQGKSAYGGQHWYRGPKPPFGTHRYKFKVYVLDCTLNLEKDAGKRELLEAMKGHVLQYGTLTGKFDKAAKNET